MSVNKCDRCGRELADANAQYGWRCAKIVGETTQEPVYPTSEQEYINRLMKEAGKGGSAVSRTKQNAAGELNDELKDAIDTFISEAKKGVTFRGRIALNLILDISIGAETTVDVFTSIDNFEHNIGLEFEKFIYDQTTGNASILNIGIGNGKNNGCGAIAIYNALQLLGGGVHPAYIIRDLEVNSGMLVGGLLGINPEAVENTFKGLGYNIKSGYLPENLDAALKDSHVGILAFAHKNGAHYVTVEYKDGVYKVYNPGGTRSDPLERDSFDEWIKGNNFIPLSLVTIPKDTNRIKAPPIYTGMI